MEMLTAKTWKLTVCTGVLALVVACGGGGGEEPKSAADDTAREISDAELSQMVLALADFGHEYTGFAADPENGMTNLETASKDDFDAAGERADLETAGFASGYNAVYQRDLVPGQVFFVASGIHEFATQDGAAQYVTDSKAELTEYLGKTIDELTIQSSTPFEADVADEAAGASQEIAVSLNDGSSLTFWYTAVLFRRGRLTGAVAISGTELSDIDQQRFQNNAKGLASAMNGRIASVLAANAPTAEPAAAGQ
jgi:hypothetical protein